MPKAQCIKSRIRSLLYNLEWVWVNFYWSNTRFDDSIPLSNVYDVHQTCIGYIKTITNKFKVYRIENHKTLFYFIWYDICFSLLTYINEYKIVKIFNGNLNSYICNDIIHMNWIAFCALIRNKFYLVNLMKRQTKRRKGRSFLNCFGDLILSFMWTVEEEECTTCFYRHITQRKNCGDSVWRCKYWIKNLIVFLFCFLSMFFYYTRYGKRRFYRSLIRIALL